MEAYRDLFHEQLSEKPKKMLQKTHDGYDSERGWVFVTNDFIKHKAVRTYQTLFSVKDEFTYFTPNTFYRNDKRNSGTLRWLNAVIIDIDMKNGTYERIYLPDLLERIEDAGLPMPSLVVKTPSGGYHVYFYFNAPKRALPKVINLYERIQQEIAKEIGGDPQAIGAERWFRIPTESNIVYRTDARTSFSDLSDWLYIQTEYEIEERKRLYVQSNSLLFHPAIIQLEQGVSKGQRDQTCYTLALAYKASGLTQGEAEQRLHMVNANNEPPLPQIDIKRKIRSAFKLRAPNGPSAYWIRQLSGMPFTYRPFVGAKPRSERKYSHLEEWKSDILSFLKKSKGEITGSQRDIAKSLNIPYSSFKEVIQLLESEHLISKEVVGKGRAAKTTIKLTNIVTLRPRKPLNLNGPNPYTFRDTVVGGLAGFSSSMFVSEISTSLDTS